MLKVFIIILAFISTFTGVEIFRRWSLRKKILDLPNERSSHSNPTPVGGGLIFVAVSLILYLSFLIFYGYEIPFGYFTGALIVSLISWADDLFSIPVAIRFICHSLAAFITIYFYTGISHAFIPFAGEQYLSYLAPVLLFFWIVWMINAYNFMDGVDGIAAVQAITAAIGWILLSTKFQLESTGFYAGILAAACTGFVILNWQPAKIFMGDVGSAFLGYTFAVIPFLAEKESPQNSPLYLFIAVLVLWFFIFDSILTLFRRVLQRKKFWQAHREHMYQKIIIRGYSHRFVTILYGLGSAIILVFLCQWIFLGNNNEFALIGIIFLMSTFLFIFAGKGDIFNSN